MLLNLHVSQDQVCVSVCKSTVNILLTLLSGQTIQSIQNKDVHIVQIKLKAVKGFKNFG